MLTPEQKEQRRGYIGSSDAAVIVGVDPWRSLADLWLDKTGQLAEVPEREDAALVVGSYVERSILDWAEATLGAPLERQVFMTRGVACATLDGLTRGTSPAYLVEAKTAGLVARPRYFDDFGEEGTDQLPDHIRIQVQHQLAVASALVPVEVAYVPVLLAGRGFVMYVVEPDLELQDDLMEAETRFWRECVELRQPPPEETAGWESIRRRLRVPGKAVPLAVELIAAWQEAKAQRQEAEGWESIAKAELLRALGDAEVGESDAGNITYRASQRKAYTVAAQEVRTLRFQGPKTLSTRARLRADGADHGSDI